MVSGRVMEHRWWVRRGSSNDARHRIPVHRCQDQERLPRSQLKSGSTCLLGELPESFQKARHRLDVPRIADHWLQDDAGNFVLVRSEKVPHGLQVIVGRCAGRGACPSKPGAGERSRRRSTSTVSCPDTLHCPALISSRNGPSPGGACRDR